MLCCDVTLWVVVCDVVSYCVVLLRGMRQYVVLHCGCGVLWYGVWRCVVMRCVVVWCDVFCCVVL